MTVTDNYMLQRYIHQLDQDHEPQARFQIFKSLKKKKSLDNLRPCRAHQAYKVQQHLLATAKLAGEAIDKRATKYEAGVEEEEEEEDRCRCITVIATSRTSRAASSLSSIQHRWRGG